MTWRCSSTQRVGRETHIIDCASAPNVGIDWLVEQANKRAVDRKFVYGQVPFVLPHDANHPQPSNEGAMSFAQKLKKNYGYASRVNPVTNSLGWSLQICKRALPVCTDRLRTLRPVHRCGAQLPSPSGTRSGGCTARRRVHDWASNLCDAFRTGVEGMERSASGHLRPATVDYWTQQPSRGRTAIVADDPFDRR